MTSLHQSSSDDKAAQQMGETLRSYPTGSISTALAAHQSLLDEVDALRGALARHDGAVPTRRLDPTRVIQSKWANRHPSAYLHVSFQALKESIALSGGNLQPIVVREAPDFSFEIVFGHRRHRACLELGLPVLAVVCPSTVSDMELYLSMERENKGRADLSAYEQGASYRNAIDSGLFSSQRRLAEALGVSHTWVSKALSVAQLPEPILDCFKSPVDIQPKHAAQITRALEVDRDRVFSAAKALRTKTPKLSATQVVRQLLWSGEGTSEQAEIRVDGSMIGSFRVDRRGRALVTLDMSAAKQLSLESISNALRRVLHVAREESRKHT
jgi:ParB family chromosome partitioning protein